MFSDISKFIPCLPSLNHSKNIVFLKKKLSPNCVPMTVPSVGETLGTFQIIVCPGKVTVRWEKVND